MQFRANWKVALIKPKAILGQQAVSNHASIGVVIDLANIIIRQEAVCGLHSIHEFTEAVPFLINIVDLEWADTE